MQYQTITELVENGIVTALGIYLLLRIPTAQTLTFAYAFSALCGFGTILLLFVRRFGKILKFKIDILEWKRVFNLSWPLALSGIFALIYTYTDSVMLGLWKLFDQVAYYNAAQKIIALSILPAGLIITAFLPTLARYSDTDKQRTQKIFDYQNIILLGIAIPLVVGGYILANGLIIKVYGANYQPAVLALRILLVMAGISYLSNSFGNILFIFNQQKKSFWAYFSGAMINVSLNILLIPHYGMYGAALATIFTSIFTCYLLYFIIQKYTPLKIFGLFSFKYLINIIISTFLMAIFLIKFGSYNINSILKILTGVFVYFAAVVLLLRVISIRNNS